MPNADAARARLTQQLAELEGRQQRLAQDLAEPLNPDSSEQAVEMEDDASLEAQAALVAREIASVNRALLRIENGTYGECVRCGDAAGRAHFGGSAQRRARRSFIVAHTRHAA